MGSLPRISIPFRKRKKTAITPITLDNYIKNSTPTDERLCGCDVWTNKGCEVKVVDLDCMIHNQAALNIAETVPGNESISETDKVKR